MKIACDNKDGRNTWKVGHHLEHNNISMAGKDEDSRKRQRW
jgi:hypothetical protein